MLPFKDSCLDGGVPSGEDINTIRSLALKHVYVCVCFDQDTYLVEQTGAKNYIQTPQAKKVLRLLKKIKIKIQDSKQRHRYWRKLKMTLVKV